MDDKSSEERVGSNGHPSDEKRNSKLRLDARQWSALIQLSCAIRGYPLHVQVVESEDPEELTLAGVVQIVAPSPVTGVAKQFRAGATYTMSRDSELSPADAWMLSCRIAEVLLNRSIESMLREPEFTDFLGGKAQPTGRIIT